MLEHRYAQEAPSEVLEERITPPALPAHLQAQIEDYLNRRIVPPIGALEEGAWQQRRAEMRAHLDAVIRAHLELGSSAEEAVSAALRHIGDTGTALRTATRTQVCREPSTWKATLLATLLFGLPWLADNTKLAANLWERWVGPFIPPSNDSQMEALRRAGEAAFYRFELFVIPLIAGLLVGLLARQRAVRGVLNGLALLAIPALLLPGFYYGLGYAGFLSEGGALGWLPNAMPAFVGLPYWIVMGSAGAALGAWLRRRKLFTG